MRIDAEQMNQLQGAEDVSSCEQAFSDQLRVEVAPILPGHQGCRGIVRYLSPLLQIRSHPQHRGCNVEKVPGEIDEVPHVAQVCLQPVHVGLENITRRSVAFKEMELLTRGRNKCSQKFTYFRLEGEFFFQTEKHYFRALFEGRSIGHDSFKVL